MVSYVDAMVGGGSLSSDEVISNLIEMGFENSIVVQAVKEVGASLDDAVEYILNDSRGSVRVASSSSACSTSDKNGLSKRPFAVLPSLGQMRQSSIWDHFQSSSKPKRSRDNTAPDLSIPELEFLPHPMDEHKESFSNMDCGNLGPASKTSPVGCKEEVDIGSDLEKRANRLLQKHFGYSSLKTFQMDALSAWSAHQDCLVLAATGSGKSLCFQIPALLTGKVVVVISPLISLMHDQCLKLSKHGVSACFLGSGQPDSSVEQKAMRGMYDIIYVCPETVLRLIKQLQTLAECRGITLFAIDEVHCVSKWGHDFRPDYRRLSVLRESFSACSLKFLKFDIPLMALTATATMQVREDVLKALKMSKDTKLVLTSFFRSNLRFLVNHSRTCSSSYEKDFRPLIDVYVGKRKTNEKKESLFPERLGNAFVSAADISVFEADRSPSKLDSLEDDYSDEDDDEGNLRNENGSAASEEKQMSIEYLENDVDVFQSVDDWDVAWGEFHGQSPGEGKDTCKSPERVDPPNMLEERIKLLQEPLEKGPTIIYVPTRKETLNIAKYLCGFGVKAAAYNASLSKSHLRRVHKEFHENMVEVVVATIAFGMGIDKLNIRRVIHYGWPQSLEAYYQEAGRAGRDGKLAECVLYANMSRVPSLLPNKRSEEQAKQAYKMLSDCFRYGMNTSCCRAKILVEYFGENFTYEKCLLCDVCVNGPPEIQNLKEEVDILMQAIAAYHAHVEFLQQSSFPDDSYDKSPHRSTQRPNLRMFVSKIREQSQKFCATDQLWWRGLARIMESRGYISEGDDKVAPVWIEFGSRISLTHVQIKFPEPTKLGLESLQFEREEPFHVYPEADMLLAMNNTKTNSTFAEWGKGWADPEIRRQRLERRRANRKPRGPRQPRMRNSSKVKPDPRTARGRIAAKISLKRN